MRPIAHLLELHGMASDLEKLIIDSASEGGTPEYTEKLHAASSAISAARLQLVRDRLNPPPPNHDAKVVVDLPLDGAR